MEFAQFLKANGIRHKTTAPFHPATNGQAERFVQTVKLALRKKFKEDGRMWKRHIDQICTVENYRPPIEAVQTTERTQQPQEENRETFESGAQPQVEGSDGRVDAP
ncbi:hypothetical protein KPH14_001330 [Odynerus spinipes]|uniref:Integrase catalytic domain-containing protein n=1 Tax=Odynerus spinipes TaxID=1348599 RepID=A0AAD9RER5_9HYME|nr:hypothetical protein KPH14_001330 [Odynerus spinipes]